MSTLRKDTTRKSSPRGLEDRLRTLEHVRSAGMNICCGGIVGLGEEMVDRADMLVTLANLPQPPESVPINLLIATPGTPWKGPNPSIPSISRAPSRCLILMPSSHVRLSAGREGMSDELQALCFLAGANSIFSGERLTAKNASPDRDAALFRRLGLKPRTPTKPFPRKSRLAVVPNRSLLLVPKNESGSSKKRYPSPLQ